MKKLLFLLLITVIAKAQNIQGTLINSETKEPIAYATIKNEKLKKSILSKSDGKFIFNEDLKDDDILEIEVWGFESKEISVSDLKKGETISLVEIPDLLPEMIIPPANAKISIKNYGRTNEGSGFMKGQIQTYKKEDFDKGIEFGIIVSNKGLSQLESFHLHLNENDSKKLIYKLQFYEVKDGKPSTKIIHEQILFSINNNEAGWLNLDLSDKNIFIDHHISKFAIILKLVDANFDNDISQLSFNTGITTSNQILVKDSEFEKWSKYPFSIPMYVKAKVYK